MLHPCTWSFPCWLVKQMSCLWASWVSLRTAVVPRRFVMRARKTESTEADDADAAHCVCPHGWAQSAQPMGGKGVCGFRAGAGGSESEVQGDMNQMNHPMPPPSSSQKKQQQKKNSICRTLLHFLPPCFRPACIHLVFVDNQSSTAVWLHRYLAQSLDLLYYPAFTVSLFLPLFLHCMPNPLIW